MGDATNDSINNLPSEEDGDSVKLQKVGDTRGTTQLNLQL